MWWFVFPNLLKNLNCFNNFRSAICLSAILARFPREGSTFPRFCNWFAAMILSWLMLSNWAPLKLHRIAFETVSSSAWDHRWPWWTQSAKLGPIRTASPHMQLRDWTLVTVKKFKYVSVCVRRHLGQSSGSCTRFNANDRDIESFNSNSQKARFPPVYDVGLNGTVSNRDNCEVLDVNNVWTETI